eukprot:99021-Amphidinium_carterae.1
MDGSPLPPPLKGWLNHTGYLPDGTPMDKAGNLLNHMQCCALASDGRLVGCDIVLTDALRRSAPKHGSRKSALLRLAFENC